MTRARRLEYILRKYGSPAVVDGVRTYAVLHAEKGTQPQSYFCVLPANTAALPGSVVFAWGQGFTASRVGQEQFAGQPVYTWAVLLENGVGALRVEQEEKWNRKN